MRHLPTIILWAFVLACFTPAFAECVSGNCVNGQGTFIYYGGKYVGQWKDGKRNGHGTFTTFFPNGGNYVGRWKDDKANGPGTYWTLDGEKYFVKRKNIEKDRQETTCLHDDKKATGRWGEGNLLLPLFGNRLGQTISSPLNPPVNIRDQ